MGRTGIFILGLCVTLAAPALASEKKRAASAEVAPVVLNGVRYQPQHWGAVAGQRENGGFVSAVDVATGRELWTATIYQTRRTDEIEGDKQDVFITQLKALPGGQRLMIENEQGARYVLDLATHDAHPESPPY